MWWDDDDAPLRINWLALSAFAAGVGLAYWLFTA